MLLNWRDYYFGFFCFRRCSRFMWLLLWKLLYVFFSMITTPVMTYRYWCVRGTKHSMALRTNLNRVCGIDWTERLQLVQLLILSVVKQPAAVDVVLLYVTTGPGLQLHQTTCTKKKKKTKKKTQRRRQMRIQIQWAPYQPLPEHEWNRLVQVVFILYITPGTTFYYSP